MAKQSVAHWLIANSIGLKWFCLEMETLPGPGERRLQLE